MWWTARFQCVEHMRQMIGINIQYVTQDHFLLSSIVYTNGATANFLPIQNQVIRQRSDILQFSSVIQ